MTTTKTTGPKVWLAIAVATTLLAAAGAYLVWRSSKNTNQVALANSAKPVTVIEAKAAMYRSSRQYVATVTPWLEAKIGPQLVSAYVDTVLVRPGAIVKKGDVLATLDCRNASAASQAVSMQARALEAHQQAVSHEAARLERLADGGFISPNEAEQKMAMSQAEAAQLLATKAKLAGTSLEVNDCILKAPFDGEVSSRSIDPGAFVKPGIPIVTMVERSTVRIAADAPEIDFDVVAPNTKVQIYLLATGKELSAVVTRRAPAADVDTRTVRFELDVADPNRSIPVGTTARLRIEVGDPIKTTEIPLNAGTVRGNKVSVFVVENNVAKSKSIPLKGELGGKLFLSDELPAGSLLVTEGRALLNNGDKVAASAPAPPASSK